MRKISGSMQGVGKIPGPVFLGDGQHDTRQPLETSFIWIRLTHESSPSRPRVEARSPAGRGERGYTEGETQPPCQGRGGIPSRPNFLGRIRNPLSRNMFRGQSRWWGDDVQSKGGAQPAFPRNELPNQALWTGEIPRRWGNPPPEGRCLVVGRISVTGACERSCYHAHRAAQGFWNMSEPRKSTEDDKPTTEGNPCSTGR